MSSSIHNHASYLFATSGLPSFCVPTVIESGVPGYEVSTWWGIVAPKSTPANIVSALNTAINSESPALKERFEREGAIPFYGSSAAFGSMLETELQGWRKVVSAGIKLD